MDLIPESPRSGTPASVAASSVAPEDADEKLNEPAALDWSEVQHRVRVFDGDHARWWEFRFEVAPAIEPGDDIGGGGGGGDSASRTKPERIEVMVWTHTDLVAPAERLGVRFIDELFCDAVRVCNPAPRLRGLKVILCPRDVAVACGPAEGATRLSATSIVTCTVPANVTNARGRTSKKMFRVGVVSSLTLDAALDLARAYVAGALGGEVLRDGTRCTENHFRAILADTAMLRVGEPAANALEP